MKLKIAWVAALLFFGLAIAHAEDKPTSLSDAQTAVEANLRTPEGKTYDALMGKEFPEKYLDTMRQCKKTAGDDLKSFWILMKLAQDGVVTEVLLYPTTKLGTCARETLLKGKFSPPPKAAYWISVYMQLSR